MDVPASLNHITVALLYSREGLQAHSTWWQSLLCCTIKFDKAHQTRIVDFQTLVLVLILKKHCSLKQFFLAIQLFFLSNLTVRWYFQTSGNCVLPCATVKQIQTFAPIKVCCWPRSVPLFLSSTAACILAMVCDNKSSSNLSEISVPWWTHSCQKTTYIY